MNKKEIFTASPVTVVLSDSKDDAELFSVIFLQISPIQSSTSLDDLDFICFSDFLVLSLSPLNFLSTFGQLCG